MIYGIGTDVVEVIRIKESLDKFGDKLARKILTEEEMIAYQSSSLKENFLAKRFAAKEAFSKALGTGLRGSVNLQAISITHNNMGKPSFEFNKQVQNILSNRKIIYQHLSISDEKNIAVAFVVLDKL